MRGDINEAKFQSQIPFCEPCFVGVQLTSAQLVKTQTAEIISIVALQSMIPPVQYSPSNFWTGIGPIPTVSGPGLNWPGLIWTSPAQCPGLGYFFNVSDF